MPRTAFLNQSTFALILVLLLRFSFGTVHIEQVKVADATENNPLPNELLYYNRKGFNVGEAGPLIDYSEGGPVIAFLTSNLENEIEGLKRALQTLIRLKGEDSDSPAPVLVFNEGDLTELQINSLIMSVARPIAFPLVNLDQFPEGFNLDIEPPYRVEGKKKWAVYQTIRFWVSQVWNHPAIEQFETIMRMDHECCFMEDNHILPNLATKDIVYHSQYIGYEPSKDTVQGLFELCDKWLKSNDEKQPGNPVMYNFIKITWELTGSLPVLRTNVEVSRKSFMQMYDVNRWLVFITENSDFGLYKYRWSDAAIRFLMIAIFADNEWVMLSRPDGFAQKSRCNPEVYNKFISSYHDFNA